MEEQKKNINIQVILIIVLLVIIAIMGFFLGKLTVSNDNGKNYSVNNTNTDKKEYEEVSITIIDDKRCPECSTRAIIEQLKLLPSLANSEIIIKDFFDEGVSEYLKENNVTALPLIVFSTNNFDTSKDKEEVNPNNGQKIPKINTYLQALPNGEYLLPVGSIFNPFQERSERNLLKLDLDVLNELKSESHIKGNKDAKITWIEYSDLQCPFCAKLNNSGTNTELMEKYGDNLNIMFNHFPLGDVSQVGAEILECLAEEKGTEAFTSLIKTNYANKNSSKSFLIEEAVKLGASEDNINKCLNEGRYTDRVIKQRENGTKLFNITGTPGNVLINNETGEYEIIKGAYPTSEFIKTIDKLLE